MHSNTPTMPKPMTRKARMQQLGEGQRMISGSEFRYAFGDITLAELNSTRDMGNALILNSLDGIRGAGDSLPYV